MESSPRQLREAGLRRRLTELAAELLKTEEELVALTSDEQLKLGATPPSAIQIPRTPAEKISLYAIGTDDTCRFLAADFDGEGWRDDVVAYREAAERVGIAVAIERSRSGNGAHAWIFFAEPVPAATARRLGTILVAKASALRPTLGLGAYDRLFPNQDTLPVGGFGNRPPRGERAV